MRWKLLRRRLSVSAPRVIVRSHLPWPLRWAVLALVLGFCAALALAAFEFGQRIAGLDSGMHEELARLRAEVRQLREDYLGARAIADTAEVVLRSERAAQERLVEQLRQAESEKHALQDDLAFFERLLPASGEGVQIRGLQVSSAMPGLLRYQLLVVQLGRDLPPFEGRWQLLLSGTLDGRPWTASLPEGPQPLALRQHLRVEGTLAVPAQAVIKTVRATLIDARGTTRATQTLKL
ncbi:MAG: hypothetical protein KF683_15890 [Rubrivivax sp.]|nr:hypothetical protein [Rubrivivax sp.]